MIFDKIFRHAYKWSLVIIIKETLLCVIEGSHVLLYLIVDLCYHKFHLSTRAIMIQFDFDSINLLEVVIKFIIILIIVLKYHLDL